MYKAPLSTLASSLRINHHLYADDTTFPLLPSIRFPLQHHSLTKCSTTDLFLDDCQLLTINSSKTEVLLIGLKQQLSKIQDCSLTTTHSARKLGFIFDEHLTFSDQITALYKT